MKLIDHGETVLVVVTSDVPPSGGDRPAAAHLQEAIALRGGGHPYRRAVIVTDESWHDTQLFHENPVISIGGPGVNSVAARLGAELPTVWTDHDEAIIQAEFRRVPPRAALWGVNAHQTAAAVAAFVQRGWLDEFLDHCWRFRAGIFA